MNNGDIVKLTKEVAINKDIIYSSNIEFRIVNIDKFTKIATIEKLSDVEDRLVVLLEMIEPIRDKQTDYDTWEEVDNTEFDNLSEDE